MEGLLGHGKSDAFAAFQALKLNNDHHEYLFKEL